jgi:hypothetical protein
MRQEAMLKRLRQLQQEYVGDLNPEELEVLKQHLEGPYTSMDFGYKGAKYGTAQLGEQMDPIIAGAPRADEPFTTYRGTGEDYLVPDEGYPLTTSSDVEHATTYGEGWTGIPENKSGLLAEIEVPERSPFLAMPDDEFYQRLTGEIPPFGDESEILLPSSKLKRVEQFEPEVIYEQSTKGLDEAALKLLIERYEYKPPYKARGGLVHGNA